jgi:hypothetical protein
MQWPHACQPQSSHVMSRGKKMTTRKEWERCVARPKAPSPLADVARPADVFQAKWCDSAWNVAGTLAASCAKKAGAAFRPLPIDAFSRSIERQAKPVKVCSYQPRPSAHFHSHSHFYVHLCAPPESPSIPTIILKLVLPALPARTSFCAPRRGPASVHSFRDRFGPFSECECDKASQDLAGEQGGRTHQLSSQLHALPHHFSPPAAPKPAAQAATTPSTLDSNSALALVPPSIRLLSSPHPNNQQRCTHPHSSSPVGHALYPSDHFDPLSDSEYPPVLSSLLPTNEVLAPHSNLDSPPSPQPRETATLLLLGYWTQIALLQGMLLSGAKSSVCQ